MKLQVAVYKHNAVLINSLTLHRGGHRSALDAGADGSSPLAGESLNSDVVGCVRLQTFDCHLCFCCTVGIVVLTVYISIHYHIRDNLSIPLSQRRGVPGQPSGGSSQAYHTQILGVAARNVFRGADLLHILLPVACSVFGT